MIYVMTILVAISFAYIIYLLASAIRAIYAGAPNNTNVRVESSEDNEFADWDAQYKELYAPKTRVEVDMRDGYWREVISEEAQDMVLHKKTTQGGPPG